VVVVGAGDVLERTFLNRVLRRGARVRIGREVDLDEDRGVASRLLENLDRLRKREVFLEKERAVVVRLGVWVGVVRESSSDEEFSRSSVLRSSREKFGFILLCRRGERFLRLLANRERREFREASDLEFDDDLEREEDFVVRRGLEIFDLETRAGSLLSPPLCGFGD